jgi:hypothetical protein
MAQIIDCLVSYFGLDERQEPVLWRHYCYHIIGSPGPTANSGVAFVTTLAVYNESERCSHCQTFHAVETGGAAAAVDKAVRYLDTVYQEERVQKVQSELRGLGEHRPAPFTLPTPDERSDAGFVPAVKR